MATQARNRAFIWHLKHAGLALAIGLGACLNAGILFHQLRRMDFYRPQPGWPAFLFKLFVAIAVMGAFLHFTMGQHAQWLAYGLGQRVTHLAGLVVGGAGMYFLCLWLLGMRLAEFRRRSA